MNERTLVGWAIVLPALVALVATAVAVAWPDAEYPEACTVEAQSMAFPPACPVWMREPGWEDAWRERHGTDPWAELEYRVDSTPAMVERSWEEILAGTRWEGREDEYLQWQEHIECVGSRDCRPGSPLDGWPEIEGERDLSWLEHTLPPHLWCDTATNVWDRVTCFAPRPVVP